MVAARAFFARWRHEEMTMGRTWMAAVVMATVFIWAAASVSRTRQGKTEAAELASESQAALQQLYGTAELAKILGPKAQAILVFPKSRKPASGLAASMAKARC